MTIILWLPSKILGAIIGLISGLVFLYVILVLLLIPIGNQSLYKDSLLVNKVVYHMPVLSSSTYKFNNAIKEIATLKEKGRTEPNHQRKVLYAKKIWSNKRKNSPN